MQIKRISVLLLVAFVVPSHLFGQVSKDKSEKVFGESITSSSQCIAANDSRFIKSCESYPFNDDFYVQIALDKNQTILQIALAPKDYESKLENPSLGDQQKEEFLKKVEKVLPLGPLKFSGRDTSIKGDMSISWLVYKNAFVSVTDRTRIANEYVPMITIVHFPFKVSGVINKIDNFLTLDPKNKISLVSIDGCSFLTTNRNLRVGQQGSFKVIGPKNECRSNQ